jgi:hypothetical protein
MPLFGRSRDSSPGAQAYESLLDRIAAGGSDAESALEALPQTAAVSGLSAKQLTILNRAAFSRYAEQALEGRPSQTTSTSSSTRSQRPSGSKCLTS